MGHSAACLAAKPATSASFSNADLIRASKPGLSGENGVSISFGIPARSAAAKICFRRTRNFDASNGPGKSATRTDQRLSYSVHSGDKSSGVPKSGSGFGDIERKLPSVGLPQRYKSCRVAAQNKYRNVKPLADHAARNLPFFTIVLTIVSKYLGRVPVEPADRFESYGVVTKVGRVLLVAPFKFHSTTLARITLNSAVPKIAHSVRRKNAH